MFKKFLIFLIIFLPIIANSQEKNLQEGLYLDVIFDGNNVYLNNKTEIPIDINILIKPIEENGNYYILFKGFNDNLIYKFRVDLNIGENKIVLPYIINAKKIDFFDKNNRYLGSINLESVAICNENNRCEEGEEKLCPLDCKSANNPYYPLSPLNSEFYKTYIQSIEKEKTATPTIPVTYAKTTYIKLILYSILFLLIIFIIFAIIYKRK
ncbi:MAG: hypothetical protein ACP5JU_00775 [Minisyncoccia bacterium]